MIPTVSRWNSSVEAAFKRGYEVSDNWQEEFDIFMEVQRRRSQTAAKGTFKGGLGGQSLQHKKYHTATHLMYQALRDVLGDHVVQHGSNITEERLRFDFSHPEKMTPEQIAEVEDIVNDQISRDLKVSFAEYPTAEATGPLGALGQFGDRYGDTVKVYKMIADGADKPFSFEICGGPHVDHTLQLAEDGKRFKIIKEEVISGYPKNKSCPAVSSIVLIDFCQWAQCGLIEHIGRTGSKEWWVLASTRRF